MKPAAQAVVATLIAVLLSGTALGQVKSDEPAKSVRISGRVFDAGGAPVANAAVLLKLAGSSDTTASTKTSKTGEYKFLVAPHRSYQLLFEASGFKQETKAVTADVDTDLGTLALSVNGFAGSGRVVMEPPVGLAGSDNTAPTVVRGRYNNVDYGYSVDIPTGLVGERSAAPNPDHGFRITLSPKSVVWVDASYDMPDTPQTFGTLNSRLGTLKAERKSWRTTESGGEQLHQAIAALGSGGIVYVIQVDTTPRHKDSAYRIFDAIVRSFRTIPVRPSPEPIE